MNNQLVDDLARSGLEAADISAVEAGAVHFTAIKVPISSSGYVIPYFNFAGERIPFYRVKLFGHELKYKQIAGTANHVYFPKGFKKLLDDRLKAGKERYVLLTEGEKKAAAAVKAGIPCVALGGVDSYRNRTIIIPAESEINTAYKAIGQLRIKLPSGETVSEESLIAEGMTELVAYCVEQNVNLIICYDTDADPDKGYDVQRAANGLGNQFVFMGMKTNKVRQFFIPYDEKYGKKVGLDDFMMVEGGAAVETLIGLALALPNAYPKHPNIRGLINTKLQQGKLTRREAQEVSLSVLADLDANGQRLRSKEDHTPFYFDNNAHVLVKAELLQKGGEPMHESDFGTHLYQTYGIGGADTKIISWLATQFTGEEPIGEVSPNRVIATVGENEEEIAVQISDSYFVIVTNNPEKPFRVLSNGSEGILFEQGHVEPLDRLEVAKELTKQVKEPVTCRWFDIFDKAVSFAGDKNDKRIAALLYYTSPWLRRWRGTQLPVEFLIGEPGSGKSTLFDLRQSILTGIPILRNMPSDLKDWYSSVANTGGLHVIDNVKFTNKEIRDRLSDEMCRIITEPDPHIEMRRLYTTMGVYRIPVSVIFGMTALAMPFYANDLIQRSAIFQLHAVEGGHDSKWKETQLNNYGGRLNWMVHHLVVLHKFLVATKQQWKHDYRAHHRLANYEQCLQIMAGVFGMETDWVSKALQTRMEANMETADYMLEAIKEYVAEQHARTPTGFKFCARDISTWGEVHEDQHVRQILMSSKAVGKYLTTHISILNKMVGITAQGKTSNREYYSVGPRKTS